MYKPAKPIRCPKCGTTVNVNTSMILTTNPPCYEWTCPNCGEKGCTKQGDIITFENQTKLATLPYIQKIDETDLGVGVTTTNATGGYNTINHTPVAKSTVTAHKTTECNIPAPQFIQQGWQCPKCGAILAPHQNYCPFCSKKESDWITTVGTGKYTNPNPSTTISFVGNLKVPCETDVTWKLEQ